jgi:hypothetical protein
MTSRMVWRRGLCCSGALFVALLACAVAGFAQKKSDNQTRSVQGVVTAANDAMLDGAVVQLKNTKSLQIRSFITQKNGTYYFHDLSPDIDYELRAQYQGASSGTKTLSSFDTRKTAIINLKVEKK